MEQISNERELIKRLKKDIEESDKEKIVFMGGHFPLVYKDGEAYEDFYKWGEFSLYTLEVACELAKFAQEKAKKKIGFVFFVDDHSYEDWSETSSSRTRSRRRRRLYREMSGKDAKLPEEYRVILRKYNFSENDVIRQDQGKPERKDCLYFSEKILRASKNNIDNACAREYIEFLENPKYFNKQTDFMVTFGPSRCEGNICDIALDKEIEGLNSVHVFFETMNPDFSKEDLYKKGRGVTYRKD